MNWRLLIQHLRRHVALYYFGVLTLAIMGPLLAPGYILTLDMTWVPTLRLPDQLTHVYPLYLVLTLLDVILPSDVIQKLVLLSILWLSGYGAYRLARSVLVRLWQRDVLIPALFAGTLYMINPFTYARFMDGHWLVLFGYALLPWLTCSAIKLWSHPSRRALGAVVAWMLAISFTSMHAILPALLVVTGWLCGQLAPGGKSARRYVPL